MQERKQLRRDVRPGSTAKASEDGLITEDVTMAKTMRCSVCGEIIPRPVPREKGEIVCDDCWSPKIKDSSGGGSASESSDMQYHGGMFHRGEW